MNSNPTFRVVLRALVLSWSLSLAIACGQTAPRDKPASGGEPPSSRVQSCESRNREAAFPGPSTVTEFVRGTKSGPNRPSIVAHIEVAAVKEEARRDAAPPDKSVDDEAGSRRILSVKVLDSVDPTQIGGTVAIHESTTVYDPTSGETLYRSELPCYRFEVGDEAVVALVDLDGDEVYQFLDTLTGFFVVEDGRLLPELAEARTASVVGEFPIVHDSDGVAVDDFMAAVHDAA